MSVELEGRPDPAAADELRGYLHELPTLAVEQQPRKGEPNAKGADPFTVGVLVLVFSSTVLPTLIRAIATVKAAKASRTMKLRINGIEIEFPDGGDLVELEHVMDLAVSAVDGGQS